MIIYRKNIFVLIFLLFSKFISAQEASKLVLLTEATQDGAVCLDGSPPAFYFRPGTGSGINKWQIHHQGGGWCTSIEDCYSRSQGALGSSKKYPPTMVLSDGYFSSNETVNPLMYNWNLVYFSYCDGGSFSGNNETVTVYQGVNLYFRGFRNLNAYLQHLSVNNKLMEGTDFIISGCSAGGLATFLHVDWWRENLPKSSKVRGMPDSGFFLDYDSTPHYATSMKWVFEQMNATSGVHQDCIKAHTPSQDTYKCFFAEHTAPYIQTPIFPVQSEYDSWQSQNILGSVVASALNTYGALLTTRFKAAVLTHPQNGCFLDSCYHHCHEWDQIVIGGYNSGVALKAWYDALIPGVFIQGKEYPCASCCTP